MANETNQTKHTVKRGVMYVEIESGKLVNTYVTLGGKRVYVDANEGDQMTKKQATGTPVKDGPSVETETETSKK